MAIVNNSGKLINELGDSRAAEFNDYQIAKTELVRVKSAMVCMICQWNYLAGKYGQSKKYPVLISIYGGPNAGYRNG